MIWTVHQIEYYNEIVNAIMYSEISYLYMVGNTTRMLPKEFERAIKRLAREFRLTYTG